MHGRVTPRERERELDTIARALDRAAARNGAVIAIEGPAGIGKSLLVAEARAAASARDFTVLRARGSELEREFSFGVVRQLFEALVRTASPDVRADLLAGAAALAGAALGLEGAAPPDDGFALLHGLYWLTANVASRRPVLLAIDDAAAADRPSLRFLAYLAQRIDDLPATLLVAYRPEEPRDDAGLLLALAEEPATTVVRPLPLGDEAAAGLLADALGASPDAAFVSACQRAAGGNPFLLGELAASVREERLAPDAASAARVEELRPGRLARSLGRRIERLGPAAAALAPAVAVLGDEADVALAGALAGLEADTALAAAGDLARAGVLADDPPIRFAHPLIRAAVYGDLALGAREAAHRRASELLAAAGAPSEQVAAHVLATGAGASAFAVEALRAAAADARRKGAADVAVAYLSRAAEERVDAALRTQVLAELGLAETRTNAPAAAEHLAAAIPAIADPARRAALELELGRMLFYSFRVPEAVAAYRRGLADAPAGDPVATRLRAELLTASFQDIALYPSCRADVARLADERATCDPLLRAVLAYADLRAGGEASAAAAEAARALAGLSGNTDDAAPFFLAIAAAIAADVPGPADAALQDMLAHARRTGSVFAFAAGSGWLGGVRLAAGDLVAAEGYLESAVEASQAHGLSAGLPYVAAFLAEARLERGEIDGAAAALELCGLGDDLPQTCHLHPFLLARARVRLAAGRHHEALADLRTLGERYAAVDGRGPALAPWRSYAALALVAAGEYDEARELARAEVALARGSGPPRAVGRALRAEAAATGGPEAVRLLAEAVTALEGTPARLELARALVDLGGALRRGNRRAQAREALARARELAHRCGATPLAEAAHAELVAAGARPRRLHTTGVDALTPSERRIAGLAAEGVTSRDIAQALFVTTKTVEYHLSNAYRKLGISSRSQLPAALARQLEAV